MEDEEYAAWSAQIDLLTEEEEVDRVLRQLEHQKPPDQRLLSKIYRKKRRMRSLLPWPDEP